MQITAGGFSSCRAFRPSLPVRIPIGGRQASSRQSQKGIESATQDALRNVYLRIDTRGRMRVSSGRETSAPNRSKLYARTLNNSTYLINICKMKIIEYSVAAKSDADLHADAIINIQTNIQTSAASYIRHFLMRKRRKRASLGIFCDNSSIYN